MILGKLLRANRTLTSLDLRENRLRDDGCAPLGEALAVNHGLRCLVLWSNGIGGDGVRALAGGLAENGSLQILDLGANNVGADVLVLKAALLKNTTLHTVGLANSSLGEEGGVAMAELLEGNGSLQRLDLRRNSLGIAGLMAIHLAMKANAALLEVALDGVPESAAATADAELQAQFQADIKAACMRNATAVGRPHPLHPPRPPRPLAHLGVPRDPRARRRAPSRCLPV